MTLGISVLNNIIPLHTKMQNYHLNITMCNATCHTVNTFVTYVDQ